jgi:hypothetical protein
MFNQAELITSPMGTSLFESTAYAPNASLEQQAKVAALPQTQVGAMQRIHFLRWNALAIDYTVPTTVANKFHVPSLMLSVQGNNLATRTNYNGKDPSVTVFGVSGPAEDVGQVPLPRIWNLRVTIGH